MDLNLVITQIKSNDTTFKLVGGSADIPSAGQKIKVFPAAMVIPLADRAAPNTLAGGAISQRVSERFGVMLAVRNVSDAVGLASLTDLEVMRKCVKKLILGWAPSDALDPVTYVGGNLIKLDDDAVLWWLETFETSYLERVV